MTKILAMDYGTKYIGLAISDETQSIADELTTLENNPDVFMKLKDIIEKDKIRTIVVGLPYHENNQESTLVKEIKIFIETLITNHCSLLYPIYLDEYGTSQMAEEQIVGMNRKKLRNKNLKKRVNQKSAQILLQYYLDQKKYKN